MDFKFSDESFSTELQKECWIHFRIYQEVLAEKCGRMARVLFQECEPREHIIELGKKLIQKLQRSFNQKLVK